VKEEVLKAGKKVAGPVAWKGTREGYSFFQAPGETTLLVEGIKLSLGGAVGGGEKKGVAPTEGAEKH
jgi:hypothetical protein